MTDFPPPPSNPTPMLPCGLCIAIHQNQKLTHLVISPGVGQDQKPGFAESVLQLIREGTGSVPSSDGLASRVLREFQHRTLTVRPCGLHDDILGVLDGSNHPRGQLELLVGLAHVDDENACRPIKRTRISPRNARRASFHKRLRNETANYHKHCTKPTSQPSKLRKTQNPKVDLPSLRRFQT